MVDHTQEGTDVSARGKQPTLDQPIDLSDNARTVLTKRYLRRGQDGKPAETIEEMFWRVAWHVAEPEDTLGGDRQAVAEDYYKLLMGKRFFPNSPTFTGAGTPLGQLAACFVLPISDDMGRDEAGIFQTLRNAALIQQTGGGNGFAFTRLRPKGARVATSAGEATGPVGFLRVYDQAFGEIAQGGSRRGANMGVLRVNHPDIVEFITCKTNESNITNFNISVGVTDDFMQAVKDNKPFDLINPQDGTVWKTVNAREVFDLMVKQAHHNGEPGVLFLDAANRDNPVPQLYQLESTNPCFIGDTRLATEFGLVRLDELAEHSAPAFVASDNRAPSDHQSKPSASYGVALRPASPAWKTRSDVSVLRLSTKQGYQVTATPDHQFVTPDGYIALKDLKPGDRILLQSGEGAWSKVNDLPNVEVVQELMAEMALAGDRASGKLVQRRDFQEMYANIPTKWSHELGLVIGWLVGDGWLSETSGSPVGMVFSEADMLTQVRSAMEPWFGAGHVHVRTNLSQLTYGRVPYEFFRTLGVLPVRAHEKRVPEALWTAPREVITGFLQGLFSADGSVQVNGVKQDCTVRLASSSPKLLRDIQLLLSNFGIICRIHQRRIAGHKAMPNGKGGYAEYQYQPQYELIIGKENRDRFAELIGFASGDKQARLEAFITNKTRKTNREMYTDVVYVVEDAGIADVYDLTQFQTHNLIANGFVASNCGEQYLGPFENCCLGSINLSQHFGHDGTVDWDKLRESTELSTRFLDNVVDANKYVPGVPQLEVAAKRVRRIGLGIMGLADLMYHVGVRYGSKEGQEFASQVMEFVHYHAMRTSVELAKDRGPFLAIRGSFYDPEDLKWQMPRPLVEHQTNWGRPAVDWNVIREGILKHGIRNGAQTTIAPTGTISTVAGCEGYGCEPVFALAYMRHFNDNGKDTILQYTSPAFEKALIDAGLDEAARKRIVEQVNLTGTCQSVPDLPERMRHAFVVASDITAEEHVWTQAVMQRFCSNAISKTCNFGSNATEEDVAKAYMLAWELGCKGLTVYVAGSRDKVVLETAETAKAKTKEAPATNGNGTNGHSHAKPEVVPTVSAAKKGDATPQSEPLPLFKNEVKRPRSRKLPGYTYRVETPLGTTFVTINTNGGDKPFEVFLHTSKAGSETAAVSEALGRLISYILRMNSPIDQHIRLKEVVRQMEGIGGGRSLGLGPKRVRSLPDGVAQVLREYLAEVDESMRGMVIDELPSDDLAADPLPGQIPLPTLRGDLCPECGEAAVISEEGCSKCYACGYSAC